MERGHARRAGGRRGGLSASACRPRPYLRNLCRKACARAGLAPSEAEDAVQETLLAIHLKRHTWDPAQGADAVDRRHRPQQDHRRGAAARAPRRIGHRRFRKCPGLAARDRAFEREQEKQGALRLLDQLSGKQREAIEAVSIRGESLASRRSSSGSRKGALRVSVHRGLKALAELYRKMNDVRMKTDDLIAALAADNDTKARAHRARLHARPFGRFSASRPSAFLPSSACATRFSPRSTSRASCSNSSSP